MGEITNWLPESYYPLISMGLFLLYLLGIVVFIIVIVRLNRLARQYRTLMRGMEGLNIEEIVFRQASLMERTLEKVEAFEARLKGIEKLSTKSIHKIHLMRFNAFQGMGGNLSFALSLLNQRGDGVVLSSIYSREEARTYAKSIKNWQSEQPLSREEEKVIEAARQERG